MKYKKGDILRKTVGGNLFEVNNIKTTFEEEAYELKKLSDGFSIRWKCGFVDGNIGGVSDGTPRFTLISKLEKALL